MKMKNRMNGKICYLGLLFSLSLEGGLEVAGLTKDEKNNAVPTPAAVQPVDQRPAAATVTGTAVPAAAVTGLIPDKQWMKPLTALEILNIQKLFEYGNILKMLGAGRADANLLLTLLLPWVGGDFSALEERSKVVIFWVETPPPESATPDASVLEQRSSLSPLIALRPADKSKKAANDYFKNLGWSCSEENGYLLSSPLKEAWLYSFTSDGKDFMQLATAPVPETEDSFTIKATPDITGLISKFGIANEIALLLDFKHFEIALRFDPNGLGFNCTFVPNSTLSYGASLERSNYLKPLPCVPLGAGVKASSYIINRDISWQIDLFMLSIKSIPFIDKQIVDQLSAVIDGYKECVTGVQFWGLIPFNGKSVILDISEASGKTIEEIVGRLYRLCDFFEAAYAKTGKTSIVKALASIPPSDTGNPVEQKEMVNITRICEHRGYALYSGLLNEEMIRLLSTVGVSTLFEMPVKVTNQEMYFVKIGDLSFLSDSLDYLKCIIDTKVVGEIPDVSLETLVDGFPPGVIAKEKLQLDAAKQFFGLNLPFLEKFSNGEFTFEAIALGDGGVEFQFFINNDGLKAFFAYLEYALSTEANVPAKADEKDYGFIPMKKDDADDAKADSLPIPKKEDGIGDTKMGSLPIPTKVAYDICHEERPILIPLKILREYKTIG
jgi:hypothetical protein